MPFVLNTLWIARTDFESSFPNTGFTHFKPNQSHLCGCAEALNETDQQVLIPRPCVLPLCHVPWEELLMHKVEFSVSVRHAKTSCLKAPCGQHWTALWLTLSTKNIYLGWHLLSERTQTLGFRLKVVSVTYLSSLTTVTFCHCSSDCPHWHYRVGIGGSSKPAWSHTC